MQIPHIPAPAPQAIPAIETAWNGFLFRSRIEARFACLFTALKISFLYEPEGFILPSKERYLPDFFLDHIRYWAEVKPIEFTSSEKDKCKHVADLTGRPFLMLVGAPDFHTYNAVMPADTDGGFADRWETDFLLDIYAHSRRYYDDERRLYGCTGGVYSSMLEFSEEYRQAVHYARSMRFGQEGRW